MRRHHCAIFFLLALAFAVSASSQLTQIAADDPNLVYTGRWNFDDPTEPWCAWQGCSVTVRFEGRGLGIPLSPGNNTHYFGVIIDGDISTFDKFQAETSPHIHRLLADPNGGIHEVEIIRESYARTNWEFRGFVLNDGSVLAPEPRPARRIEFYGDSNLDGTSNEHERDRGWRGFKGTTFVFAGIVSRMFDAEYHNISWGGETIAGINKRGFDRMEHDENAEIWDHVRFPADLVVANIGANDIYDKSKAEIKEDYHELLDDLRGAHPSAHIMLYNAFGWDMREPSGYTHEVILERGDPNMSSAVFPWLFEQFHGCQYDQGGMAQYLANHIDETLGWQPLPIDTLNGYGMGGDVANGSFEEVSPFGGWAWRYFDDVGVARVLDPAAAHDGDYYLALRNGAKTHQPNPTQDGQVVNATLWLRGENEGARAQVSIEFRNQQIFSDAMESHSEFFELTTEWQLYTISATAPTDAPDPVFNSRVAIQAGPTDSVAVDSISMTIE